MGVFQVFNFSNCTKSRNIYATSIYKLLEMVFEQLTEILFPSEWKKGNAVRIYKKEDMHRKITLECRYLWEYF